MLNGLRLFLTGCGRRGWQRQCGHRRTTRSLKNKTLECNPRKDMAQQRVISLGAGGKNLGPNGERRGVRPNSLI